MILLGEWDDMTKGLLSLLMMLSAVAIMLIMLRRHQFRGATRRDVAREQLANLREQGRLHQSMDDLLIQLEEVSRRVSAQVDTKFAKLEQVVRDADVRIARLERLLGKHEGDRSTTRAPAAQPSMPPTTPPSLSQSPAQAPPAKSPVSPGPSTPREPSASREKRNRQTRADASNRPNASSPARPASPAANPPAADPPANNIDPRFQHVYDLVDAGHSPIQAAEALSLPLGEVELILNLRRYR